MAPVESLNPDQDMWHWIAVELRFWRERAGLSLSAMSKIMGCNKAHVSNVEHGRPTHRMNEHHAKAVDQYFGLGEHFQRLVRYARSGHDPDWFRAHVIYEQRASVLKIYEAQVIPGLLQTPDYARALLRAGRADDVEAWANRRIERQAVLTRKRDRPEVWVILSQNALDWPVGGPAVMREQLARLLDLDHLPNVTVRVLPRSVGEHVALEGSFKVITIAEGDVIYMEACGGGRTTMDAAEVSERRIRFDRIGADALTRGQSRDLIRRTMESYDDAVA
ncbi:helix-turn-helix domain-containing protein [Actinomadura viridis]|uniref:helix-turn-helix domain-containing protein n=1 Tax=Actinomadura viridis TaxID=58110 RepID=UPI003687CC70